MASSSRRIVVAGATGAIGGRLVRKLAGRGDSVTVLARDPERARRELPDATSHVAWSSSMTDGEWTRAIDGAAGVINLAGAPIAVRWSPERKRQMYDSRIEGTRNIVRAIAGAGQKPEVLVNASAVGYYGVWPAGEVTESSLPGSDLLASLCVDWESEARKAEEAGIRVVCIRTGIVLDPNGGALQRMLLPFKLFVGGPIGGGKQPFPWIHVDDEIGMFLWALDSADARGPVNAVSPGIVSNRAFSSALGRALHRPSFLPVPEFAMKLLFGEGSVIVTGGQHARPEQTLALGYRFQHPGLDEALQNLLG